MLNPPKILKIPGFIDLQVNGYMGIDFSSYELSEDEFIEVVKKLVNCGTWIFLPTIITSPPDLYERNLKLIARIIEKYHDISIHVPGIHLEGPFISEHNGARGIHNPGLIRKPSINFFEKMLKWANGKISILTMASELEGSKELIHFATRKGVIVSLGHQLAGGKEIDMAIRSGAKLLTHLGNGIPHMIHRHYNPIFEALARDELSAMLITDGHHLPLPLIKTIIKAKTPDKTIVTSDSSPLAGLPPGRYNYKGSEVVLKENKMIFSVSDGYLAGSGSNMLECMNYLASLKLMNIEELLKVGFYNQVKLLNKKISISAEEPVKSKKLIYDENRSQFKLFTVQEFY